MSLTKIITCPVCKVQQRVDVRFSLGMDEIKPGVFNWVPKGETYAVCAYKNCRHILTSSELEEQSTITITCPADFSKALKNQKLIS